MPFKSVESSLKGFLRKLIAGPIDHFKVWPRVRYNITVRHSQLQASVLDSFQSRSFALCFACNACGTVGQPLMMPPSLSPRCSTATLPRIQHLNIEVDRSVVLKPHRTQPPAYRRQVLRRGSLNKSISIVGIHPHTTGAESLARFEALRMSGVPPMDCLCSGGTGVATFTLLETFNKLIADEGAFSKGANELSWLSHLRDLGTRRRLQSGQRRSIQKTRCYDGTANKCYCYIELGQWNESIRKSRPADVMG